MGPCSTPSAVQKRSHRSASNVSISKRTPSAERNGGIRSVAADAAADGGSQPGSAVATAMYWVSASTAACATDVVAATYVPPRSATRVPAVTA
jgi:hypothetical protein